MSKRFLELKGRKFVKDLRVVLKDIEPYVRAVRPLWNGRPFTNFSLRAREIWSLWLLCVVLHEMYHKNITFGEDDESDGIIADMQAEDWIRVENVSALDNPKRKPMPKGEQRIIEAIESKIKKGAAYAKGKMLTVFFDGAGSWHRNKVREAINGKHSFEAIYLIGLLNDKGGTEYSYTVTELHENDSVTFEVKIARDFSDWTITRMQ